MKNDEQPAESEIEGNLPTNSKFPHVHWVGFPGASWIATGLKDLAHKEPTLASMAVLIAQPRLAEIGFVFPEYEVDGMADPEKSLHNMLCAQYGNDANAAFNAIRQELVSFANAFDHAISNGSQ